jgi:sugar phosphate isomerase/epimerase
MSQMSRRSLIQSAGALGAAAALGAPLWGAVTAQAGADAAPAAGRASGPKFRLGIVTYNVAANWDVPTILRVCKSAGIPLVELRTTHKHGVEPTLSKSERQEVKKQFGDAGIEIWGLGTVCEFHAPDPSVVEKNIETCKQFVQLAADLGAKGVKVRPNGLPRGVEPPKTIEQIGKALVPCGKAAEGAGIEIWVEVHGGGTAHPPVMKQIMNACGHPKVGVTWNSNADDRDKSGSITEHFKLLRPHILSVHINDLWKDAAGQYPYRELFRLLRESGYDRATLCEVGKVMPDEKFGEEFLRYYKALWTELNRA